MKFKFELYAETPDPDVANREAHYQVAVIAETVRAGRAAGTDDTALAATLGESKMMPECLRNRI